MYMNTRKISYYCLKLVVAMVMVMSYNSYSQEYTSWSFAAGINIIDNSNGIDAPWDADRLEFKSPFFLEVEYRRYNWAISVLGTTNQLKLARLNEAGDGFMNNYYNFFAIDITNKFYLDQYLFNNKAIGLYAGFGFGYHEVAQEGNALTANLNIGFNYWLTDQFGLTLQGIAKKGTDNEVLYVGNYYQYNLGLTYRIVSKKKKKVEKEVTTAIPDDQPLEAEAPPVAVAVVETQPAEAPVAANAAVNDNAKDVAADTQGAMSDALREAIEAIGPVYFDKNSSYFDGMERRKLVLLIELLNNNPTATIRLDSYTDATGTVEYNRFMSDRRLKRVRDYLINKGVNPSRIAGVSNGVDTKSICNDAHTNCNEAIHQTHRRVDIAITN
jgi:outer membrane protein OmpA-like peptidoglycan-associated protein